VVAAQASLEVGRSTTAEIVARNMRDLYGVQFRLVFDPWLLGVEDADPSREGIQIEVGDLLVPDVTVVNQVDHGRGIVDFAVGLLGDRPGVEGGGALARLTFRALAPGVSPLRLEEVRLSDPRSAVIAAAVHDASLQVVRPDPADALVDLGGRIVLAGRRDNAGAKACVGDACVETGPSGRFLLPGVARQPLHVRHPSFLGAVRDLPPPDGGITVTLADLVLRPGDVDQDDRVADTDAVAITRAFAQQIGQERWDARLDLTGDGAVDVRDLDTVIAQFGARAETGLQAPTLVADGAGGGGSAAVSKVDVAVLDDHSIAATSGVTTEVVISPALTVLQVLGRPQPVDVLIRGAVDVFAYSLLMSFDPRIVRVVELGDPTASPGVHAGDFLGPAAVTLASAANNDPAVGAAQLVYSRLYPEPGEGGDGRLARLFLQAVAPGQTALHLEDVRLFDDYPGRAPRRPERSADGGVIGLGSGLLLPLTAHGVVGGTR